MSNELHLHNDINEIPSLGDWVEWVGETYELDPATVFQLNLALEEAVVNVMSYAYPNQEGRPVTLIVSKTDNQLVFKLTDNGVPFDPTKEDDPDITLSPELRQVGGLGIFLVKQLMSSVEYHREGDTNILTMTYNK